VNTDRARVGGSMPRYFFAGKTSRCSSSSQGLLMAAKFSTRKTLDAESVKNIPLLPPLYAHLMENKMYYKIAPNVYVFIWIDSLQCSCVYYTVPVR
jgi:hypothetical protein